MLARMVFRLRMPVLAWTGVVLLAIVLAGGLRAGHCGAAVAEGTTAEKAVADVRGPGGSAAAIRGAWRGARMEQAEQEVPEGAVRQLTVVVDEKRLVMRQGQQLIAETPYTVDAVQNPPTIKLTYEGQATHGIWQRKADTLTLCLADVDQARPKKFVVGSEGGKALLVLQLSDLGERIPLLAMDVDGKNLRTLVALPEYTAIGSSACSPDGKRIAFDAWRTVFGEGFEHIHEFVANADGTGVRDLGEGRMPGWSPDSKQLTLTLYHGNSGVWILNADGTGAELVDRAGFGSAWCPTGNRLAYATYGSSGANLCVYDMGKGEGRLLLTRAYRQVCWGMAWSPDGQWIAFKGDTEDGKSELAAVHVDGEAKGFKVLLPKAMPESGNRFSSHIAWGGDGKRVLVGLCHPDRQSGHKLYFLDFAQKDPPQLVPGPYPDGYITGVSLSRDGKRIQVGFSPSGNPTNPSPTKKRPAAVPAS
jgi:TolB protein